MRKNTSRWIFTFPACRVRGTLFFWHFPCKAAINHRAILSVNQIIIFATCFAEIKPVYEKKPSSTKGQPSEKGGP
jgi:hypothetical protein